MSRREQTKTDIKSLKPSKILLEWEAPEYIQHEKSRKWYMVAAGIALVFIVMAILTDNLTMALAVLVFAGVYYYMQINHVPRRIQVKLTGMGIYVGDIFLPYGRTEAFWIITGHGINTLNLRITNRYHSDFTIQLDGQEPSDVRDVLIKRVPEWEGRVESFSDTIFRLLKL